ncbi:MAG: AAA family ATPase, partial [Bacteroidota bacterium]|nr:AAA family ATPase [Bacteroidota bacterium]
DVSNIKRNTSFNNEVSELSYNKMVFFMPFWSQIYQNDNERIETKNQAIKIENQLRIVYLEFGFELVEVPKLNIFDRANFILKRVQKNN